MRSPHSIQQVLRSGLCISCGACVAAAPAGTMRMALDNKKGVFLPEILDRTITGRGEEFAVCPGRGMPIVAMAKDLFGDALEVTFELGRYRKAVAAYSTDTSIVEHASSGGVMTEIAAYLLERGEVEGVTVSRFVYGPPGPRTETIIVRNRKELLTGQGSKYCPTSTNAAVAECVLEGGRFLFLGTPCQVGALRLAMQRQESLRKVFPFTMANFCGGYRNFRDLDDLIAYHGLAPEKTTFFRFRGGGQPGSMLVRTSNGMEATEPYPDYCRHSRVPEQKRCVFCLDATGELADFACGDAWVSRFKEQAQPWSIILCRSRRAVEVLDTLIATGHIVSDEISFDEIVRSQRVNLDSKKFRQKKRMRVYGGFGGKMPKWDAKLPGGSGSYLNEIKALLGKYPMRFKHGLSFRCKATK